jgi:uroporphyrinogen decarboxylase
MTLCKTPELAAEITVFPVKFLGVDAAILFSDLLFPCEVLQKPQKDVLPIQQLPL